jgi:hypothetical protein
MISEVEPQNSTKATWHIYVINFEEVQGEQ